MQKALEFIREQQEEDGSWYGRWGVNYIYGTWQVLRGLRALNVNMNQPWLLKARDWLESVQHEDGGWGERCNTYDDPVFKGQGPSTASQTAWAVMGLCAFDDPDSPSAQTRHRVSDPHAKSRRLVDGARNHRHGFPEGVLSEIRHVSQRLAAAGAGDLPGFADPLGQGRVAACQRRVASHSRIEGTRAGMSPRQPGQWPT